MTSTNDDWLPLRFRDLDAYGHVYHAEYLTLLDEARSRWFAEVGFEGAGDYVLAHLEIDWLSPLGPEDRAVRVDFAVERVGTTSITLRETMQAPDGRGVSRSRSVSVRWDPVGASARPLSASETAALLRQQQAP